jgi:hypothetical protein
MQTCWPAEKVRCTRIALSGTLAKEEPVHCHSVGVWLPATDILLIN